MNGATPHRQPLQTTEGALAVIAPFSIIYEADTQRLETAKRLFLFAAKDAEEERLAREAFESFIQEHIDKLQNFELLSPDIARLKEYEQQLRQELQVSLEKYGGDVSSWLSAEGQQALTNYKKQLMLSPLLAKAMQNKKAYTQMVEAWSKGHWVAPVPLYDKTTNTVRYISAEEAVDLYFVGALPELKFMGSFNPSALHDMFKFHTIPTPNKNRWDRTVYADQLLGHLETVPPWVAIEVLKQSIDWERLSDKQAQYVTIQLNNWAEYLRQKGRIDREAIQRASQILGNIPTVHRWDYDPMVLANMKQRLFSAARGGTQRTQPIIPFTQTVGQLNIGKVDDTEQLEPNTTVYLAPYNVIQIPKNNALQITREFRKSLPKRQIDRQISATGTEDKLKKKEAETINIYTIPDIAPWYDISIGLRKTETQVIVPVPASLRDMIGNKFDFSKIEMVTNPEDRPTLTDIEAYDVELTEYTIMPDIDADGRIDYTLALARAHVPIDINNGNISDFAKLNNILPKEYVQEIQDKFSELYQKSAEIGIDRQTISSIVAELNRLTVKNMYIDIGNKRLPLVNFELREYKIPTDEGYDYEYEIIAKTLTPIVLDAVSLATQMQQTAQTRQIAGAMTAPMQQEAESPQRGVPNIYEQAYQQGP